MLDRFPRLSSARLVPLAALIVAAGCADTPPATAPSADALARVGKAPQQAADQLVARAIAAAMADPQVRAAVRDAMRASPVTEHKLVLQEYTATRGGAALLAEAARASGVGESTLRKWIATLPAMDFYVPLRADRLSWRGSADVAVAAKLRNNDAYTAAWSPDGRAIPLVGARGRPGTAALFVLEPAEAKGRRIGAQPQHRAGSTIQDPDDGELSAVFVWTPVGGDSIVVDLADAPNGARRPSAGVMTDFTASDGDPTCDPETAIVPCDDGGGSGGSGGGGSQEATRVASFYVTFCDTGADCRGGNEVEFRARYYNASGVHVASGTYRQEGVSSINHDYSAVYYPNAAMIQARLLEYSAEYMTVELVETDNMWAGGNDYYGTMAFGYQANGQAIVWPNNGACSDVPGCTTSGGATFTWTPRY